MKVEIADLKLPQYETYFDYIHSMIKKEDTRYLRSIKLEQNLVKLGYRTQDHFYNVKEFFKRREVALAILEPKVSSNVCFGKYLNSKDPVLLELQAREPHNVTMTLSTIIFIKAQTKSGFELDGFIDLEDSCRRCNMHKAGAVNWRAVFEGRTLLKPKLHDLSYHNSKTNTTTYNNTDNFSVLHDPKHGLMFIHRGDHKTIPLGINPPAEFKNNVKRSMVRSPIYGFVVFYDHVVRKKV